MKVKVEWKRVVKDAEHSGYFTAINEDLEKVEMDNGQPCIIAGTYLLDDGDNDNKVQIGYITAVWYLGGFLIPEDFYKSFYPLYWDKLDLENPIHIAIGVKFENKNL